MKKRQLIILGIAFSSLLAGSAQSFADDNGSLQLNPNVITNSDGGGTASDFPIRSQLFTPEIEKVAKAQEKDDISKQKEFLNFSDTSNNILYNTNTTKIVKQLFVDYQPQVISSNKNDNHSKTTIVYWIIFIIAFPLIFLAVLLGRKNAKRSIRRKR
ncbi:MAG: type VII secretion protein EssA [Streptococcaceae bacterium]|nr:type VII secretion protein EssA [Streptococcaceae bacterium]